MAVYDVGINDAKYVVKPMVNGKRMYCPFYTVWQHMLQRCYSKQYQDKNPTYVGCYVTPSWHSFMSFRAWMLQQDWRGKELDKDVLHPGNKEYSPATCVFIPHTLNSLLNTHPSIKRTYPLGVYWDSKALKFKAQININGKRKNLGRYVTSQDAQIAYLTAKIEYLIEAQQKFSDPAVSKGIGRHITIYKNQLQELHYANR